MIADRAHNDDIQIVVVDKELEDLVTLPSEGQDFAVMFTKADAFRDSEDQPNSDYVNFLSALDETMEEYCKRIKIVIVDSDDTGEEVAEALKTKGFDPRVYKDAEKAASELPLEVQINLNGMSFSQRKAMAAEIRKPHYLESDIMKIINRIKQSKPIDVRTLFQHPRNLRKFRREQIIMEAYCRHSGNIKRVNDDLKHMIGDIEKAEADGIAGRNELQYYLNRGSGENLHNRLMSKAFGEGYRDFLLRRGKLRDYITDEGFMKLLIRRTIEYMRWPGEAFSDDMLTEGHLEALKESVEQQLGMDDSNREQLISALEDHLLNGSGAEPRRVYRSIVFEDLMSALGGREKSEELRKKVGGRFREVIQRYLKDDDFGPRDLSSLVREEHRIEFPGRNPVFRVEVGVLDIGSIAAVVKVFDYRIDGRGKELTPQAKQAKMEEFRKEIRAADYFSRWGMNKTVHFFFEEYDEFSAVMMRCWGENNLLEIVEELDNLTEDEAKRGPNGDESLIEGWRKQKDKIFLGLMKKMAEVHAYSPDISVGISDPTENYAESLQRDIFGSGKEDEARKDLFYLFEKFGTPEMKTEVQTLTSRLREVSHAFAEYLQKVPVLQDKTACKDTALPNWVGPGLRVRRNITSNNLDPIDYGTLRNLPAQMDVGNAFVIGNVVTLDEVLRYSRAYFKAHENEIRKYNKKIEGIADKIENEVRKQFRRKDLCRKGASQHIGKLSKQVIKKVKEAADSKKDYRKLTAEGTVNPEIIKVMEDAYRGYVEEFTSDPEEKGKKYMPESEMSNLKMFCENAVGFFRSIKTKECYLEGCESGSEEEEARFQDFWEGMLASMAYKTLRNARAQVGFVMEGLVESPAEYVGEIGNMVMNGAVETLDRLVDIYEKKKGSKAGEYNYTNAGFNKIYQMAGELRRFAEKCKELETHLRAA
jgi:hypothetical protein